MNPKLHHEMVEVLTDLRFDKDLRVLILTGAGESFSAGEDLKEFFLRPRRGLLRSQRAGRDAAAQIEIRDPAHQIDRSLHAPHFLRPMAEADPGQNLMTLPR